MNATPQPGSSTGSDSNEYAIGARIERLPLSWWHLKLAVPIGSGWFFEAFDSLSIAFVLPVLIGLWKLEPAQIGYIISAGFVGQMIGAIAFARLAERIGRVPSLFFSLLLFCTMSLLAGFANSVASLVLIRFLQGLGLGGEIPVIVSYTNEWANSARRGRFALIYQSIFAIGIAASAYAATFIIPRWGWEWVFFIGAVPALVALPLRRMMPESPRWLASRGRMDEADRVLRKVETEISATGKKELPPIPRDVAKVGRGRPARFSQLFKGIYLRRTLTIWTIGFFANIVIYALINWMPSLYKTAYKASATEAVALGLNLSLVAVVAVFTAAAVIDIIGRKWLLILGLGVAAASLAFLALNPNQDFAEIRIYVTVAYFFINFVAIAFYNYASELYPTELRAHGVGAVLALNRTASIIGPWLVGLTLGLGGISGVYGLFAIASAIGALVTLVFAEETRRRTLEEISPSR